MRGVRALASAAAAALLLPAAGGADPTRDELVRPGVGIGKVQLGMTLEQARGVLGGQPRSIVRRLDLGLRGRYVELGWEVEGDRGPSTWTVGLRSSTRGGRLRVVRVATTVPAERTREGLGVGSRPRDLVRAHPEARCVTRYGPSLSGYWVVAEREGAGMTAFQILYSGARPASHDVLEVLLQKTWFSEGPRHAPCSFDWRHL